VPELGHGTCQCGILGMCGQLYQSWRQGPQLSHPGTVSIGSIPGSKLHLNVWITNITQHNPIFWMLKSKKNNFKLAMQITKQLTPPKIENTTKHMPCHNVCFANPIFLLVSICLKLNNNSDRILMLVWNLSFNFAGEILHSLLFFVDFFPHSARDVWDLRPATPDGPQAVDSPRPSYPGCAAAAGGGLASCGCTVGSSHVWEMYRNIMDILWMVAKSESPDDRWSKSHYL
jgi:hypothetical protein